MIDDSLNIDNKDLPTNESDVEHNDIRYANSIKIIIDKILLSLKIVKILLGINT